MNHFNFNGKILAEGTAVIGPANRGLRYGDGLFETIKCVDGKLQLSDLHFARLWKGMGILQFTIPVHFTPEGLEEQILALAKKNGHLKNARIRLTVFRGEGGLYDPVNHQPNYLIETWELPETKAFLNSNGLVMGIYTDIKKNSGLLANLKHNNHLPYVLAAIFTKKQQWNDAVVLNQEGRLCDTTIANLFIIKDEMIQTPPLSEGCIAGVVREHLLKQLPALGFAVKEMPLTLDDLMLADEVFVTNSIHPVRWVRSTGEKNYDNQFIQKIFSAILPTID